MIVKLCHTQSCYFVVCHIVSVLDAISCIDGMLIAALTTCSSYLSNASASTTFSIYFS